MYYIAHMYNMFINCRVHSASYSQSLQILKRLPGRRGISACLITLQLLIFALLRRIQSTAVLNLLKEEQFN